MKKKSKKRVIALFIAGVMMISSVSVASANYQQVSLTWSDLLGKSGNNVSALGGVWNYSLTLAYQAYSTYNHGSKNHRAGVYTPNTGWVFTDIVAPGTLVEIERFQVSSIKGASCGTY